MDNAMAATCFWALCRCLSFIDRLSLYRAHLLAKTGLIWKREEFHVYAKTGSIRPAPVAFRSPQPMFALAETHPSGGQILSRRELRPTDSTNLSLYMLNGMLWSF